MPNRVPNPLLIVALFITNHTPNLLDRWPVSENQVDLMPIHIRSELEWYLTCLISGFVCWQNLESQIVLPAVFTEVDKRRKVSSDFEIYMCCRSAVMGKS